MTFETIQFKSASILLAVVTFLSLFCSFIYGKLVQYTLIYEKQVLALDGFPKVVITVNGSFPGPMIECNQKDTLRITVINNMPDDADELSIHWHGIKQINTPWADGTVGITNCPIPIGRNHTYTFLADSSGTYWYHSHYSSQRSDGGSGILVIHDPNDPYLNQYDEERYLLITDWYHTSYNLVVDGLLEYGKTITGPPQTGFTWPGNGDSILLNGIGNCISQEPGCNNNGNRKDKISYIDIQQNKRYRLRIVNIGVLGYFNIAIANHELTLIRLGGMITEPAIFQSFDLGSGERADFIINTHNKSNQMYRIYIQTNWRGNDMTAGGIFTSGLLRYSGSTMISSIQPKNESKTWNTQYSTIKPWTFITKNNQNNKYLDTLKSSNRMDTTDFTDIASTSTVNKPLMIYINGSQQYVDRVHYHKLPNNFNTNSMDDTGYLRWTQNGVSYRISSTPLLLLASLHNMESSYGIRSESMPISVSVNQSIVIIVQNFAALNGRCEAHPWHIHGNDFQVLATGDGLYHSKTDSMKFNYQNPIEVDTFTLLPTAYSSQRGISSTLSTSNADQPCGWMAIQFKADNPGMWIFHCHISWHLDLGMAIVFDVNSEHIILPDNYEICGSEVDSLTLRSKTYTVINNILYSNSNNSSSRSSHSSSSLLIATLVIGIIAITWSIVTRCVRYSISKEKRDLWYHKWMGRTITSVSYDPSSIQVIESNYAPDQIGHHIVTV